MSYVFSLLFENTNLALVQDTQTDLGASKFILFLLSSYDPKHLLNQTFYYLFVCFWGLKSVWFTLISPRLHLCFSRYIITNVIISRPNAGKMSWKDIILPTKDFHLFLKKKKSINRKSARVQLNVGGAENGKCPDVSRLRTKSIQMYHRLESSSDPAPLMVVGACLLLGHRSPPHSIRINVPALSNT